MLGSQADGSASPPPLAICNIAGAAIDSYGASDRQPTGPPNAPSLWVKDLDASSRSSTLCDEVRREARRVLVADHRPARIPRAVEQHDHRVAARREPLPDRRSGR